MESVTQRRRFRFSSGAVIRRAFVALASLLVLYAFLLMATWPDVPSLRHSNPATTAFMEGYRERTGRDPSWTWVPYSRISPQLKKAVLVSEDLEFFSHAGFSEHEIREALRTAVERREMPRGASTITQQLAKNLWLSPSRNPVRKLKEAQLTTNLESHLSKTRILEIYLNIVEFGPGVYGAEAAARTYFDRPAAQLSQRQAAMLAAGLPRPGTWNPSSTSSAYERQVGRIVDRMNTVTFLDSRLGLTPESRPPEP